MSQRSKRRSGAISGPERQSAAELAGCCNPHQARADDLLFAFPRPPTTRPGRHGHRLNEEQGVRVAMIGSGYVDLVSEACLADFGHVVTCIDSAKIDALRGGAMPIYEPGLSDLVAVRAADDCVKTTLKRAVLVDLRNIDTPQKARAERRKDADRRWPARRARPGTRG